MKYLITTLIIFTAVSSTYAQNCCMGAKKKCAATEEFALLASKDGFNAAHLDPEPFEYSGEGDMITYEVAGGDAANAFIIKADKETNKYLFVIHEWWGLNDHIKDEAHDIYHSLDDEVNIIALDLYDGNTADTRDKAAELMQAVDNERAVAIIKGALAYAGADAEIATIGWCFGGGWSLQTALFADEQAVGCVMYYGMPEKDVAKLAQLHTDVLGIFATQDEWINPEVVSSFEQNMEVAGKELTLHSYDAPHAFANPSNPGYDKKATEDAMDKSIDYLQKKFE